MVALGVSPVIGHTVVIIDAAVGAVRSLGHHPVRINFGGTPKPRVLAVPGVSVTMLLASLCWSLKIGWVWEIRV